jgi:hypothetical protein
MFVDIFKSLNAQLGWVSLKPTTSVHEQQHASTMCNV